MRLSTNPDDPGYFTFKALPKKVKPVVTVDGVEVKQCFTADDRLGYVLAADLDADGKSRLNARRDDVLRKQVRGDVRIELRRRA